MDKKIIFLALLILSIGCVQQVSEEVNETTTMEVGEFTIETDKQEYIQGDIIKVVVENNLNEPVYFASCGYLILEKRRLSKWEPVSERKCRRNTISHSLSSGEHKEFILNTRYSAKNYWDKGGYRERFDVYYGCPDENISNCRDSGIYTSDEFEIKNRKLPEIEDMIDISMKTDKEEYIAGELMQILLDIESQQDIYNMRLTLKGVKQGCYRVDNETDVSISKGLNSFEYKYQIPKTDSKLKLEYGVYGINADITYTGTFEGIHYENESVASAREKIRVV